MNWQPMESVPKDGSPVLLLVAPEDKDCYGSRIHTGSYATNSQGQVIGIVGNMFAFDMPKPIGWILQADLLPA